MVVAASDTMKNSAKKIPSPWAEGPQQRERIRKDKRVALLRAAAREFGKRGFAGTSLDDIAAALGISKPTIYYHVGDKDELFHACLVMALEGLRALRGELLSQDMSARAALGVWVRSYVEILTGEFGYSLATTELHGIGKHTLKKMQDDAAKDSGILREILVRGKREGEFDVPSVGAALSVIAGALGWITHWYDEGEHSKQRIAERFIELIERMLLVKDRLPKNRSRA